MIILYSLCLFLHFLCLAQQTCHLNLVKQPPIHPSIIWLLISTNNWLCMRVCHALTVILIEIGEPKTNRVQFFHSRGWGFEREIGHCLASQPKQQDRVHCHSVNGFTIGNRHYLNHGPPLHLSWIGVTFCLPKRCIHFIYGPLLC